MAKEHYNVADRSGDFPVTAADKVSETVFDTPDADARDHAETNNVSQAAYANYATALGEFEDRPDIEPLAARRAREYGDDFADGDFMRRPAYDDDGTAAAPPRPGTVHGDAPKEA